MISWLSRNPLFSILITQVSGFVVLGYLLLDHASAPHQLTRSSAPADNVVTGPAPVSAGYQESHALLPAGAQSAVIAACREDTKPERLSGNAVPVAVAAERRAPNPEAFRQSNETVERAISSGLWSQQDSRTFRQHMAHMSDAERIELLEKISGAVNRQQLKLEGPL